MIEFPESNPPIESYVNHFVHPPATILRWEIPGYRLIVGGSVVDAEDWSHLYNKLGITHVLSLDHAGRHFVPSERIGIVDIPDNGLPIAAERLRLACGYARELLRGEGHKLYIQDKMGAARGAAIGYAILRSVEGLSHDDALVLMNLAMPHSAGYHWGYNDAARAHIGSVDLWIDEGGLPA